MAKIAFYDTRSYDKEAFTSKNEGFGFEIDYFDFKLNEKTAFSSKGFDAVCVFVNDVVNAPVISILKDCGIKIILLRCAGFNNVDLDAAKKADIKVVRVPAYSPHAVAEHSAALLLSLTRHIPQAYMRTRTGNFNIEGLTGRDLYGLTAGVFGTGKIGRCMAEILNGFGMKVICYDPFPDNVWAEQNGFSYVDVERIFRESDVLTFHCPLTDENHHIVNKDNLKLMKKDGIIINTSRGALIDTKALVYALKHKQIGGAALDVYEEESAFFFKDCSAEVIADDVLARLLTFPNVLITGHQAFLTTTALSNIAEVTLNNFKSFLEGQNIALL
ncbi:MAG: 2-hydroxyacid dehydrogenase [Treponema sp.]|nr:2-hydroxyacid dehydrogenase [Treponema sp.]